MTVNVVWLLPCAALAMIHPQPTGWDRCRCPYPLVDLAVVAGAGRRERANRAEPVFGSRRQSLHRLGVSLAAKST